MGKISDSILNEIDKRGVEQVPAWRFTLSAVFAWVGFVLLSLLGAHAVSVILYLFAGQDWTGIGYFRGGWLAYSLSMLPHVWLAALVLLVAIAFLDFRRTRGGYRHRPVAILGAVLALSVALGLGLHALGVGERTDEMLEGHVPQYRRMVPRGFEVWNDPSDGRLVGRIESVSGGGVIEILSPGGEAWEVFVDRLPGDAGAWAFEEGQPVRVIGERLEGCCSFRATVILPWGPGMRSLRMPPRPAEVPSGMHLPFEILEMEEGGRAGRIRGERAARPLVHPVSPVYP